VCSVVIYILLAECENFRLAVGANHQLNTFQMYLTVDLVRVAQNEQDLICLIFQILLLRLRVRCAVVLLVFSFLGLFSRA